MLTKMDLVAVEKIVIDSQKPIKSKLNKVEKLLHVAIDLLDRDIVEVKKRVDKIEWRLGKYPS